MNKMMMIRGAALMAILGVAPVATAKSLQALIWAPNYGSGATFQTCNGSSTVWGQATGRDSSGNLMCLARAFNNSAWVTTACGATATQHNASLRSVNVSHCTSPTSAWPSLQFCSVNNFFMKVNGGACVNAGTVNVWSNAIN